jgi:hypothetical protein
MKPRNDSVNRLVPDEPFPSYTFVPGQFPHPTSDPAGHSYGVEPPIPAKVEPEQWQACRPYLYGIDLFNAGFYWESHVAWESLWIACGRKGPVADFLKGLIKLAAAGVKALEGKPRGVKSHGGRAAELFQRVMWSTDQLMGFRVEALLAVAEAIRDSGWPSLPPLLIPKPDTASSPGGHGRKGLE